MPCPTTAGNVTQAEKAIVGKHRLQSSHTLISKICDIYFKMWGLTNFGTHRTRNSAKLTDVWASNIFTLNFQLYYSEYKLWKEYLIKLGYKIQKSGHFIFIILCNFYEKQMVSFMSKSF